MSDGTDIADLYYLLQDEGIELVQHFIPNGGWWFDAGGTRYLVTETEDGMRLTWSKRLTRERLDPSEIVEIAKRRARF